MSDSPFEFLPIPPEVLAQLRSQHERHHMQHQDASHMVRDFLVSLSDEHLQILDMMLAASGGDETFAVYYRGRISQLRYSKFNVCPCGEKHDPDEVFSDTPASKPTEPEQNVPGDFYTDKITTPDNEVVEVGSTRWYELLKKYSLVENIDDRGEHVSRHLKCVCGLEYQSLQDRMLRPPGIEGCSGCQQRSAWG